ncbi:unnamed protein product [Plutella xylostella]|uniref:Fucosyltransferase n=1 Tax=Plutella xylostella TaxID=51655 RepID=A0A8S4GA98_PLUXY|nr:unnamed protein product [Plutella xylostella]
MPITSTERNTLLVPPDLPDSYDFNMKYLLFWTPRSQHSPFTSMQEGVREFVKNNCEYKNCFLTANRSFFESITKFDAILFHGKELSGEKTTVTLPQSRSPKQKYIFATIESANNYPVCDAVYDGFFNWTWTYRLDSDVRWGYLTVLDMEGRVVGPKVDMSWRPMNETIDDEVRGKLKTKSKAVAWMVSNCRTRSLRELYALDLRKNLSALNLELDIYGACEGLKSCPKNRAQDCNRKILNNYYFYLAFENSFSVDYVTEKVLNAMDNLVVPIVYGDANYSRFLPPGSYINAREFSPEQLADTISNLMSNSSQYEEFFSWRRFYRIVETTSNADVCNLCAAMNDHKKFMSESVYSNFREWWNDKDQECPDRRKNLVWKYTFT